jgi:hypothetical protein
MGLHCRLARRHQGRQRSRSTQYSDQCKLTPQDELELINFIGGLEKQGLPPTKTMVQYFASTIAGVRVSSSWVTRFQHLHHDTLIQKWANGMDAERHNADSNIKYNKYFDLLHEKMEKYKVQPHNTYNMAEGSETIWSQLYSRTNGCTTCRDLFCKDAVVKGLGIS